MAATAAAVKTTTPSTSYVRGSKRAVMTRKRSTPTAAAGADAAARSAAQEVLKTWGYNLRTYSREEMPQQHPQWRNTTATRSRPRINICGSITKAKI